MREANELGSSVQSVLDEYWAAVHDSQRQWAAKLLREYPDRHDFAVVAEIVRGDLRTDAVEVNSVTGETQMTLAKAPGAQVEAVEVPVGDSLCVMVVATGAPAVVSDIAADPMVEDHVVRERGLRSWASVPIVIDGCNAGTVCALETENPRDWTDSDQANLVQAAQVIGERVTSWSESVGLHRM